MHRVLVLGGYGFFGSRICTALARNPGIHLLIAGRDLAKATALAYQLGRSAQHAKVLDATSPQLAQALSKLQVGTLIHTAGPFQDQNYAVAQACIQAGCNYLDLADGREFVKGIVKLDAAARAANVCVVSGVEHGAGAHLRRGRSIGRRILAARRDPHRPHFRRAGAGPRNREGRVQLLRAAIHRAGKRRARRPCAAGSIRCATNSRSRSARDGSARCDVPDLDLLPQRYPGVKTVSFHAGFASDTGHRAVEKLARLVRDGKIESALPFARALYTVGRWIAPLLSEQWRDVRAARRAR